jgi:ribosomal-protein-alanine N-acetyltransferase
MTPEDLAALHNACFPDAPITPERAEFSLSMPANRLYTVDNAFLLASVVPPEAEITHIGVHPRARRQGQARRLLDALKADASKIFLEVSENNTAAIRLYESAGFKAVSRRKLYYETPTGYEDALLMTWTSATSTDA